MKKGLFTLLFTFSLTGFLFSQTPSTVPAAVKTAFNQAMPGVNATYTAEGSLWKAGFTQNGKQMYMVYDAQAVLQFTETALAKAEVPAPALQDMEARFSNFTFEGVAKRDYPDGVILYEYQYLTGNTHVEVLYQASGQMVKRNVFQ